MPIASAFTGFSNDAGSICEARFLRVGLPPWEGKKGQRYARLRADLDTFTQGAFISIAPHPYRKLKSAYIARVDPPKDEVWDIRSRDPKPAIRAFGCFAKRDTFVILDHYFRAELDGPTEKSGAKRGNVQKRNGGSCSIHIRHILEQTSMSTSRINSILCRPEGDHKIASSTLAYFRARNRNQIYDLVMNEFAKSGVSQAVLARRLGKGTDQVCRWLGAPGNWTLDSVSDLLFVISGAEPKYEIRYPLEQVLRNFSGYEWPDNSLQGVANSDTETDSIKATTKHSWKALEPA